MESARTKVELLSTVNALLFSMAIAEARNSAAHLSTRESIDVKLLATVHGSILLIKIAVPGPTTLVLVCGQVLSL